VARYQRGSHVPRCAEVYAVITELYRAGKSLDDIGLLMGCSGQKIGNLLRECGVDIRPHGRNGDAFRFVPGRDMKWRPDAASEAA
jgi:hypothetical protein